MCDEKGKIIDGDQIIAMLARRWRMKKILKGGYPLFGKVKLRKDEILKTYPDINKAKNKINWRPKISFKKGLKVTIDAFK